MRVFSIAGAIRPRPHFAGPGRCTIVRLGARCRHRISSTPRTATLCLKCCCILLSPSESPSPLAFACRLYDSGHGHDCDIHLSALRA